MQTFTFPSKFIERFLAYRNSEEYHTITDYAKSEYWKYFSDMITVDIEGNTITVRGGSGYYIPPLRNKAVQAAQKIKWAMKKPQFLFPFIKRKIKGLQHSRIKFLSHFEAFDAVMNHDPIANIISAAQRIDFIELRKNPLVVSQIKEMRKRFFAKDKYRLNSQMVEAYYLWNIICGKTDINKIQFVLEIGAGNGNLAALLRHHLKPTIIIVDLPETLCLSIPFIADLYPEANILMPQEVSASSLQKYDFIFLTPNQLNLINDNSVDLVINTFSFQEMNRKQISEYFHLIERAGKNNGYFLTQNRVEKIPTASACQTQETAIKFSEYPWMPDNEVLIYQICPFSRLLQLDNSYIRLEKIVKKEAQ